MPIQPNTDDATGVWKTNQLYHAKSGEVWPDGCFTSKGLSIGRNIWQ